MSDVDMKDKVEALKKQGNASLTNNNAREAIKYYSEALELDPTNHVLLSNRSAAYAKAVEYQKALQDAEAAIKLKPDWFKGYSRKGTALSYMDMYGEAIEAYGTALKLEPNNAQVKESLSEARNKFRENNDAARRLMNPFADPTVKARLMADHRTKDMMQDPSFLKIITELQNNPQSLKNHIQDQRVMTAFSVLLGLPEDGFEVKTSDEAPPASSSTSSNGPSPASTSSRPHSSRPGTSGTDQKMDVDPPKETDPAVAAKNLGNEAYKKKDFEAAHKHYDEAILLDPTNISFYSNKAAVYFEQGKHEECIELCKKAVEIGQENRADYKLIARAFARIGNSYNQLGNLEDALLFYNKSLSEHRDASVIKKANDIDKQLKERAAKAYINPDLALEEKQKGNDCYQKGQYPEALKHYTEAIKRNPEDAKIYSNRAACYTKLLELNLAIKDCDECIRLDPTFVKGHLRKAACLMSMKDSSKAADSYRKVLELDPNCQEAVEGYQKCMNTGDAESSRKRAMQDPEVQSILGDPAMQMILEQMQSDPKAVREHLKNPEVANKIMKLYESGLIQMR